MYMANLKKKKKSPHYFHSSFYNGLVSKVSGPLFLFPESGMKWCSVFRMKEMRHKVIC